MGEKVTGRDAEAFPPRHHRGVMVGKINKND